MSQTSVHPTRTSCRAEAASLSRPARSPALLRAADLESVPLIAVSVVVAVWCAAYVNAFNFMDGINGLAVGQTLVAGFAFAWLAHDGG
jgi:UDP-GlcNAc:undecaprenyl-phosphate/decaprenyl-phosphate GlcNAc-1-phosphate transferase